MKKIRLQSTKKKKKRYKQLKEFKNGALFYEALI